MAWVIGAAILVMLGLVGVGIVLAGATLRRREREDQQDSPSEKGLW